MTSKVRVKICGLSTRSTLDAAVQAGAAYVGFVFFTKSPRHLTYEQAADLARYVPSGVGRVALTVNATDVEIDMLTRSVPLDMLQLQGSESPERAAELRQRTGLQVMKAVGVATAGDLKAIDEYAGCVDQILVDAKPAPNSALPGGNGLPFDWELLQGRTSWPVPWMLAGGLNAANVQDALHRTGAPQLDISSGVESAPGVKDAHKIRAFLAAATA